MAGCIRNLAHTQETKDSMVSDLRFKGRKIKSTSFCCTLPAESLAPCGPGFLKLWATPSPPCQGLLSPLCRAAWLRGRSRSLEMVPQGARHLRGHSWAPLLPLPVWEQHCLLAGDTAGTGEQGEVP